MVTRPSFSGKAFGVTARGLAASAPRAGTAPV